jgi:hypothetical protein
MADSPKPGAPIRAMFILLLRSNGAKTRAGNRFDRNALLAVLGRLVDLIEAVELHQLVEQKPSLLAKRHEARDEEIPHAEASGLNYAVPRAASTLQMPEP